MIASAIGTRTVIASESEATRGSATPQTRRADGSLRFRSQRRGRWKTEAISRKPCQAGIDPFPGLLELTRQYAEAGWRVIAACRTPDRASDLQALAGRFDLHVHPLDTGSDLSVTDLATALQR